MAGDRMARAWAPIAVPSYTMVSGAAISINCLVHLDTAMGRELRSWTVTRLVANLQLTSSGSSEFYWGLRVANENEPAGSIDPAFEQNADWVLWGGAMAGVHPFGLAETLVPIDNRSQRKSRGNESQLLFYISNAGPDTGYIALHGRALMLLP